MNSRHAARATKSSQTLVEAGRLQVASFVCAGHLVRSGHPENRPRGSSPDRDNHPLPAAARRVSLLDRTAHGTEPRLRQFRLQRADQHLEAAAGPEHRAGRRRRARGRTERSWRACWTCSSPPSCQSARSVYYSANYRILPEAVTNTSRYGNTYSFVLSHHKIECLDGKPAARDVSLGNVSVQVNSSLVDEATVHGSSSTVGFSFLPRGYYQRKDKLALPEPNDQGVQEFNFSDGTTVWWLTRPGALPFRVVTRREFLQKQIEILTSRSGTARSGWPTTRDSSAKGPMRSRSSRRSRWPR